MLMTVPDDYIPATAFSARVLSRRMYIEVTRKNTPPSTSTNVVISRAYCRPLNKISSLLSVPVVGIALIVLLNAIGAIVAASPVADNALAVPAPIVSRRAALIASET